VAKNQSRYNFQKKIGREFFRLKFHDRLDIYILAFVDSHKFTPNLSRCFCNSNTKFDFYDAFCSCLNLYKKVYILNL